MKLLVVLSLFGLTVMADTYEYKINGMTCSACKKAVKSTVCSLPGIKECKVEVGSMKLTSEDGKTLDQKAISDALDLLNKKNDSSYTIAKSTEVKNQPAETKMDEKK